MSLDRFLLKQPNRIFRWPGFRPSHIEGMERSRSALENKISSCKIQCKLADSHMKC